MHCSQGVAMEHGWQIAFPGDGPGHAVGPESLVAGDFWLAGGDRQHDPEADGDDEADERPTSREM